MTTQLTDLVTHWTLIAPLLSIENEEEYDAAVERLNFLLDEIGTNENHPLYSLLDTLGTLIHNYEEQHHDLEHVSGPMVLELLMAEHDVSSSELTEIGPVSVVEQYLAGRSELTLDQIRAVSRRFHVSPAAFI